MSFAAKHGAKMKREGTARDRVENAFLRALFKALLALPYDWRVPLCGWVMTWIIAPLAGYRRRIRENLAMIMPEMPEAEVRRLMRRVPDNVGRTVIEAYSGEEFRQRAARSEVIGGGLAAAVAADRDKRPVIFVTAHFGNYEASRAAMTGRGYQIGALYRPMNNPYFNEHYVAAMASLGEPVFPRGRQGLGGMLKFLRGGGKLGMLVDLHIDDGAPLQFFGHTAMTALTAGELALKYDALLIPAYAVRLENGLDFRVILEDPIPHTTPEEMTQALNDSLEALVRQHMDQWFWIHRRWKPSRTRRT